MSRSERRTPIVGHTTAVSEKDDKRRAHRAARAAARAAIAAGAEAPHPKAFGNPWDAGKDGKQYLHRPEASDFRK